MSRMFSVHIIIIYRYILEYYTDQHNVDEDRVTVAKYGAGSDWTFGIQAGVTSRTIYSTPADSGPNVAFNQKNIHNEYYHCVYLIQGVY